MIDWQEGDVVANGIRLHYYRTGAGKTTVVLSHGFTDSGLCWTRLAGDLAGEYDVVTYDLRAHGRSEVPESGYSADDRAADLAGLIRALGLERPHILGHSMGAETTAYTAAQYPDLVRGAVLEDPPFTDVLYAPTLEQREASAAPLRARILEQREMPASELISACRAEHPNWAEEELGPWAEAKRQVSPKAANRRVDVPREPWRETLGKIACPVLTVTADVERGGLITPAVAGEIGRIVRDARIAHVAGAGHNVHRDRHEPFLTAVRAFLAKH